MVTTDPDVMLAALDEIQAGNIGNNNPDCEEPALEGLRNALELPLLNSLGFLVSDASAKDYNLFDIVASLLQETQAQINFLLSGNCGHMTRPEFQVFGKIARVSDGQVFDMSSATIDDILQARRVTMEAGFGALRSFDSDVAEEVFTTIEPDSTTTKLSVSLSGEGARLVVRDSNGTIVTSDESFSSSTIKILSFDVQDKLYTIEAVATSAFSLRIGGLSELSFRFGFSWEEVSSLNETSIQPVEGHQNILSIFVSNPSMLKRLTHANFVPSDGSTELKVPVRKVREDLFVSDFLDIPTEMMRIQIQGQDLNDNLIERMISTRIGVSACETILS